MVTGVEAIAAITLAVQISGDITAIVTALEKLQQVAVKNTAGVQRILVDVGLRSVPIDELTDADKKAVAEQIHAAADRPSR